MNIAAEREPAHDSDAAEQTRLQRTLNSGETESECIELALAHGAN